MVALYADRLAGALKGPLPLVVLLWGDEAGAIRQAAQQVAEAVAAQTGLDLADPFGVERLGLSDLLAEPSRLTDACLTLSFTSPHKLVWVRGVSGTERADDITQLTEQVKAALQHPLQGVTLLLPLCGHLDKKHPLVKLAEEGASNLAVRFFTDTGRNLEGFLKAELAKQGVQAEPAALSALAAGLGADREVARREIEKLVCYAYPETTIRAAHVTASLCGATPYGVMLVAEAVLAQNPVKVDMLLGQLLEQGEDLNGVFSMILNDLNKIKQAQAMRAAGADDDTIARQCGKGHLPMAVKHAFMAAVQRYPANRLNQMTERSLEALTLARSGLLPSQTVLGRAILGWSL